MKFRNKKKQKHNNFKTFALYSQMTKEKMSYYFNFYKMYEQK